MVEGVWFLALGESAARSRVPRHGAHRLEQRLAARLVRSSASTSGMKSRLPSRSREPVSTTSAAAAVPPPPTDRVDEPRERRPRPSWPGSRRPARRAARQPSGRCRRAGKVAAGASNSPIWESAAPSSGPASKPSSRHQATQRDASRRRSTPPERIPRAARRPGRRRGATAKRWRERNDLAPGEARADRGRDRDTGWYGRRGGRRPRRPRESPRGGRRRSSGAAADGLVMGQGNGHRRVRRKGARPAIIRGYPAGPFRTTLDRRGPRWRARPSPSPTTAPASSTRCRSSTAPSARPTSARSRSRPTTSA